MILIYIKYEIFISETSYSYDLWYFVSCLNKKKTEFVSNLHINLRGKNTRGVNRMSYTNSSLCLRLANILPCHFHLLVRVWRPRPEHPLNILSIVSGARKLSTKVFFVANYDWVDKLKPTSIGNSFSWRR